MNGICSYGSASLCESHVVLTFKIAGADIVCATEHCYYYYFVTCSWIVATNSQEIHVAEENVLNSIFKHFFQLEKAENM